MIQTGARARAQAPTVASRCAVPCTSSLCSPGGDGQGAPPSATNKEQREEQRKAAITAKGSAGVAGKDASPAVLTATDTTEEVWRRYMHKHGCWALPHVFVVDRTGTILWHGQVNRRGLVPALKTVVRQVDEKTITGRKGE